MSLRDWANRSSSSGVSLAGRVRARPPGELAPTPPRPPLVDATGAPLSGPGAQPNGQPRALSAPEVRISGGLAPPPTDVALVFAPGGRRPDRVEAAASVPPCVQLVKVDAERGDMWERRAARIPDLAQRAGLHPDVDAMKMAGLPPGVAAEKWASSTRYFNGVTDLTAEGHFDAHRARRDREIFAEQDEGNV